MSDKYQVYLGIDPGASGGIAAQCLGEIDCVPMPKTEADIWTLIGAFKHASTVAVIENVHAMPINGSIGSFKLGYSYGGLRMALTAAGIRFEDISPQRWQKTLGVTTRKRTESKTVFKNRLKAKAQQLFPEQKVTLATADALLLLEYCTRIYKE
jgi:hypothetical protein